MPIHEPSCRCGAVALRVSGEPVAQLFCHCDDCQAAHSAAYVASMIYARPSVEVARGLPAAMVIKATKRMHCSTCSTYLFSELEDVGMRSVNAYLMPKAEFRPQFHVQCQHAIRPVVDDLPHFRGFPAAFGGSDEVVSW